MRLFINSAALKDLVPDTIAKRFHLVRMNLTAAACPQPYSLRTANSALGVPVVVIKNGTQAGHVAATGYIPAAIVAAGEDTRKKLMRRGVVSSWVWAEAGLNINCDDEISSEELSQKLQALLTKKFSPAKGTGAGNDTCCPGTMWPWICKIYPFENYLIYDLQGQKYRQGFLLNPVDREVTLSGEPTKVEEKYVNAAGIVDQYQYPVPQTGLRPTPAIARPYALGIAWGSPNSELFTQVTRDWANINEAVNGYLSATKLGLYKPMVPAFQPVKLSADNHILSTVTAAGIAPVDFVRWSGSTEATRQRISARQFSTDKRKSLAKKGQAMKDGSYPIVNTGDLKNAVQSFGRSPDKATKSHIIKRAKALGAPHMLPDNWNVAAGGPGSGRHPYGYGGGVKSATSKPYNSTSADHAELAHGETDHRAAMLYHAGRAKALAEISPSQSSMHEEAAGAHQKAAETNADKYPKRSARFEEQAQQASHVANGLDGGDDDIKAAKTMKCMKCDATLNQANQFVNAGGKKMNYCKACYGKEMKAKKKHSFRAAADKHAFKFKPVCEHCGEMKDHPNHDMASTDDTVRMPHITPEKPAIRT